MTRIQIDVRINGKLQTADFNMPEKWDDVPAELFPHLASIYLSAELSDYDKTVRAFVLLADKAWTVLEKLQPEELYDVLYLVDWVFDKLDLKKNILPVIKVGGRDFIGPANEMDNLRFAEWCAADTFMVNFAETQDLHELHQLAAVLYRPAGTGDEYTPGHSTYRGDRREKFNDQLLKERTALMAKLSLPVIQAIYVFYCSCRKPIIDTYPVTFPEKKTDEIKTIVNLDGWLEIYDDLRENPRYVGLNVLDEEMLHSVLYSIERNNIKMKKLKEEYDI